MKEIESDVMQDGKVFSAEDVAVKNKALKDASQVIFGKDAELRIVNPAQLVLLKHNARYFKKEQFKQLVNNLKNDQRLSSTPLCHPIGDDKLEVLSGNHRVQASIEAGLPWILIIIATTSLSDNEKIATQLSHNALVGEDDDQILAELWNKIDDIKAKCYAGLSSETVENLKKIKLVTFSTPQIRTKQLSFAFAEPEIEAVDQVLTELTKIPADTIYLVPMAQFDDFFTIIQKVKKKENIKNGSLAALRLVDLAGVALNSLQEEQA